MKKKVLSLITSCLILIPMTLSVMAHPGRTDSKGGHYNRATGEYHYHSGGGASRSSGSSSSGSSSSKSKSSSGSSSGSSSSYSKPKTVYATKVNVSNMPSSIYIGESVRLNGTVYPSNAEDKLISWESSDTSIALVDSNGNLTAVGVGKVVISAKTSRGTTSKFDLTVKEIVAESISIEGKVDDIFINETINLSVIFTPENTTYKDIEWSSADSGIANIDETGKLTALALGKTTITATHKELTDSFEIEVKPILAESIEISCINEESGEEYDEMRFEAGEIITLNALVLPDNTTDASVKWYVSDTNVATIDEIGNLTMVSEGTVTVTAQTSNGLADEIEVEVYKTSPVVDIIAGIVAFTMYAGVIAGVVFLIKRIRRKLKKK